MFFKTSRRKWTWGVRVQMNVVMDVRTTQRTCKIVLAYEWRNLLAYEWTDVCVRVDGPVRVRARVDRFTRHARHVRGHVRK